MKKPLFITAGLLGVSFLISGTVLAQGMMGYWNPPPDTAALQSQEQEEQEGKQLLDDLSSNTVACAQLNDADFEKIGEYAMGQSIGDTARHLAMNEMMKRMMGEQGEAQMHTVMGKRYSGCDPSVAFPSRDAGFWPMMGMMWGGGSNASASPVTNNPMMNDGYRPSGRSGWTRHFGGCW